MEDQSLLRVVSSKSKILANVFVYIGSFHVLMLCVKTLLKSLRLHFKLI